MARLQFIAILFICILTSAARGEARDDGFSLRLETKNVSARQIPQLEQFLHETAAKLPESMKTAIGRGIAIRFVDRGDTELTPPVCPAPGSRTDLPMKVKNNRKSELYGLYYNLGFMGEEIRLNKSFIQEILKGEEKSRKYDCGHRSLYRLAQATLVHELAHAYDHEMRVSSSARFIRLMKFHKKKSFANLLIAAGMIPEGYQARNILYARSPDPYEFKNPKESFAVNIEFFVLDPEYACRRPAVNDYLSRVFGIQLHAGCTLNTKILLNAETPGKNLTEISDLNPDRIYQVHYFLAAKGEAMMSRWGHGMYRLVVCAPERDKVGPDCLNDVANHVVVSFRANVDDIVINHVKGIFGGYPSQLFLLPLHEVVSEYTKGELRDILSAPIAMTDGEKRDFIFSTLEQYWGYLGKYRFFTNNCGTESLVLAKGALEGRDVQKIRAWNPQRILKKLNRLGRTDPSVFGDRENAEGAGLFFRSEKTDLEKSYRAVVAPAGKYHGVFDFLDHSTTKDRADLYQSVVLHGDRIKVAAHFLVLESEIALRYPPKLQGKVLKALEASEKRHRNGNVDMMDKVLALVHNNNSYPWQKLHSGYGVPLEGDFAPEDKANSSESKDVMKLEGAIKAWVEENFMQELNEQRQIEKNRTFFRDEILKPSGTE